MRSFSERASAILLSSIAGVVLVAGNSAQASLVFTYDFSQNTPGVGFLDPTTGAAREATLEDAGNRFSTLFGKYFTNSAVISLQVTSSDDPNNNALATAGSNLVSAPGTFGGSEVVRQKIITGFDANGAVDDGTVDVNWSKNYQLNYNTAPGAPGSANPQFDLYSILFHEFTHAIGFSSNIFGTATAGADPFGDGVAGSGNKGSWTKLDQFITTGAGVSLINKTTFEVNQTAEDATKAANGTAIFDGPNADAANGGPVAMFTGDYSHLDPTAFGSPNFSPDALMVPGIDFGPQARDYSPAVVGILTDIGYTAVPEPTSFAVLSVCSIGLLRRRRTSSQSLLA